MAAPRLPLVCAECGKKFWSTNPGPECPRCGGTDIELREELCRENPKKSA